MSSLQNSLVVVVNGQNRHILPLREQLMRVGSDRRCELVIDHPELAAHAATLDCCGGGFLLCNLNPFPIYLGNRALESQQWADWHPGELLRLTKSIVLDLQPAGKSAEKPGGKPFAKQGTAGAVESGGTCRLAAKGLDEPQPDNAKTIWQMAVIGLCVVVGLGFLLVEPAKSDSAAQAAPQLIAELHAKSQSVESRERVDYQEVCGLLQSAWIAETTSDWTNPERAIEAFYTLRQHERVKSAVEGTLLHQVRLFAARQMELLRMRAEQ
jgi:hypothetical protein